MFFRQYATARLKSPLLLLRFTAMAFKLNIQWADLLHVGVYLQQEDLGSQLCKALRIQMVSNEQRNKHDPSVTKGTLLASKLRLERKHLETASTSRKKVFVQV